MICDPYDVVAVPFPFSEIMGAKRRPAVTISKKSFNEGGHTVLAMITTKDHPSWPGDFVLKNYQAAGLRASCIVRLKIFTLDNRLLIKRVGRLSETDSRQVIRQLRSLVI